MLAEPPSGRLSFERARQLLRLQVAGADQNLAELSLVIEQGGSRRIGVFGLEPDQGFAPDACACVSPKRLERGDGIDEIATDRAQRYSEREHRSIKPTAADHARAGLEQLQEQRAEQQPGMQIRLRQSPMQTG